MRECNATLSLTYNQEIDQLKLCIEEKEKIIHDLSTGGISNPNNDNENDAYESKLTHTIEQLRASQASAGGEGRHRQKLPRNSARA